MSLLIAVATIALGQWIALGDGDLPHETRVALDFEESRWTREYAEHKVITRDQRAEGRAASDLAEAETLRDRSPDAFELALSTGVHPDGEWNRMLASASSAWNDTLNAATTPGDTREHRALQRRAAAAVADYVPSADLGSADESAPQRGQFAWWNDRDVRRMQSIVDHGFLPRVERYHTPLDFRGAVRMVGAIAGLLLSLIFFVVAPVLVSVQQAQESHENTLMPLIGTSLTPRGLSLGLLAGGVIGPMIVAAPLLALMGVSAVVAGVLLPTLAFTVVLFAGGFALSATGQLAGQFLGRRRTPGAVAISLLGLSGIAWMAGLGIGFESAEDPAQAITLLPQAASAWLLAQGFGMSIGWSDGALSSTAYALFQAGGAVALGALSVRALARRIALTEGPTLTRGEALAGLVAIIAMVCTAGSEVLGHSITDEESIAFYFATLAPTAIATLVLAMGRVPLRDAPPSMMQIPLRTIAAEVFAAAIIHLGAVTLVVGAQAAIALVGDPAALFHWTWAWAVIALLAARLAALPPRGFAPGIALGACLVGLIVTFANAFGRALGQLEVIMLADAGLVLGLTQAVGLVVVPGWLFHTLRARLGALR
jgi:hypothetical protein